MAKLTASNKALKKALVEFSNQAFNQPAPQPFVLPDSQTSSVTPQQAVLAQYMNIPGYNQNPVAPSASPASPSTEKSALSQTFGWLGSLGHGVENIAIDAFNHDGSPLDVAKNIGLDAAGAYAAAMKPLAEIAMAPGINVPGENTIDSKLNNFIQKENTTNHGSADETSGVSVLKAAGVNGTSTHARILQAIGGLGIDILSDPTTYLGPGLLKVPKEAVSAVKGIEDAVKAGKDVAEAAPSITPEVRQLDSSAPTGIQGHPQLFAGDTSSSSDALKAKQSASHAIVSSVTPDTTLAPIMPTAANGLIPKIASDIKKPLTPAAQRSARASQASRKRWYEDLVPVEVKGKKVSNIKTKTPAINAGGDAAANLINAGQDVSTLSRKELATTVTALAKDGGVQDKDLKYFAKGFEDTASIPDSERLSTHIANKGTVEDFANGRPRKVEAPELEEAIKPGITQHSVADMISDITSGVLPRTADKFVPATGEMANIAQRTTEDFVKGTNDATGASHATLGPANQAQLWNKLQSKARETLAGGATKLNVQKRTISMMRSAEDHALSIGHPPMDWNGSGLRLTDVMSELSPQLLAKGYIPQIVSAFSKKSAEEITDPVVKEAFERAMASRKIDSAGIGSQIMDNFAQTYKDNFNNASDAFVQRWKAGVAPKQVKDAAVAGGLTNKEADSLQSLVRNFSQNSLDSSIDSYRNHLGAEIARSVAAGRVTKGAGKVLSDAIADMIEEDGKFSNVNKALGKGKSSSPLQQFNAMERFLDNNAVNSVLTRLTTWAGRGPMYTSWRDSFNAVQNNAVTRAGWFVNMRASFSKDEMSQAWKLVASQGLSSGRETIEAMDDGDRVKPLAQSLLDLSDSLFGSKSAWKELAMNPNSLDSAEAIKAQMTFEDLDQAFKATRSPIRMSKIKGKGDNWLDSIGSIDPMEEFGLDPAKYLFHIDRAFSNVATKYALDDDFAMSFGQKAGTSFTHTAKIDNVRFADDVRFDPKVANQYKFMVDTLYATPWSAKSGPGKAYFTALRMWKSGVTIYRLAHHISNVIGDSFLTWMDGISDPTVFSKAQKVLWTNKKAYGDALQDRDFSKLQGLLTRDQYDNMGGSATATVIKKQGATVSTGEIYRGINERGLLNSYATIEDIVGKSLFEESKNPILHRLSRPLGGKAHNVAAGISEYTDHFSRTAHFIGVVQQRMTPAVATALNAAKTPTERLDVLKPLFDEAAARVKKFHPNGQELTKFEQSWGRGLIPFYAWTRKTVPTMIQSLAEHPENISKLQAYPRANYALQQALGIQTPSPENQFPVNQLIPSWLTTEGLGPIGVAGDSGLSGFFSRLGRQGVLPSGEVFGSTILSPSNPFDDTISQWGGVPSEQGNIPGFLKNIVNQSSPAIQLVKSFADQTTNTGAPIPESQGGQGWGPYIASQIPGVADVERITKLGQTAKPGTQPIGGVDVASMLNYLLGAGVTGTGQYYKSALAEQQAKAKAGN
jgi:hypothetical protein